jgi:hypothetical protein
MRLGGPRDGQANAAWVRGLIAADKLNDLTEAGKTLRQALEESGDLDALPEDKKKAIQLAWANVCTITPPAPVCMSAASATFNLIAMLIIEMTAPKALPLPDGYVNGIPFYRTAPSGVSWTDENGNFYISEANARAAGAVSSTLVRLDLKSILGLPYDATWKSVHDAYVFSVLGVGDETIFKTEWSTGTRGYGDRKLDHYDPTTQIGYEGNTTPWSEMTQEQLTRKLKQIADDYALLNSPRDPRNPALKEIIWFGTDPIPANGLGAQIGEALRKAGITYIVRGPYKKF